jgi:NADPH-dependent 2,4-dienoyl-CoA reductase/sulfur reductase-like enzyme
MHDEGGEPKPTYLRTAQGLSDDLDVDLMLGTTATGLDTARKVVLLGNRELDYDGLVIATGSVPRRIPGTETLEGVHVLRTLDDARRVRDALSKRARTVIIGAGFIGSEIASSAKKRGVDVTVIEALATPLVRAAGEPMGLAIASLHERNGTTLLLGTGVKAIEGDGHVERVVLDDGRVIAADLVVVGIGVVPATAWLEGSGLTIENGVVCDETLWTGAPGVYAAGDVANWFNPTLGEQQRLENWTSAAEQGGAAGRNAVDPEHAQPYRTVPYFWSDWYDIRIQFVGSPRADEVMVVDGDPIASGRWAALYRRDDRLIGALTVQGQSVIMKYRGLISRGASWDDALRFAAERRAASAARSARV